MSRIARSAFFGPVLGCAGALLFACRAPAPADAAPPLPSASAAPPKGSAAAPPPAGETPRASREKKKYVVAAIGDSLTDPLSHGGLYLRFLGQKCPESRFDSYGKGGEMVNQMRRRFERDLFGEPPDPKRPRYTHVIVFGGVNDLYSDLTANRTVKKISMDLTLMYAAARAHGARVVALTVTPWGGFHRYYSASRAATTAELNRWILAQEESHGVDVAIDAYPLLACGEELCEEYRGSFTDGLHFGPKGHERLAAALYERVFADCR